MDTAGKVVPRPYAVEAGRFRRLRGAHRVGNVSSEWVEEQVGAERHATVAGFVGPQPS